MGRNKALASAIGLLLAYALISCAPRRVLAMRVATAAAITILSLYGLRVVPGGAPLLASYFLLPPILAIGCVLAARLVNQDSGLDPS